MGSLLSLLVLHLKRAVEVIAAAIKTKGRTEHRKKSKQEAKSKMKKSKMKKSKEAVSRRRQLHLRPTTKLKPTKPMMINKFQLPKLHSQAP
jgi:hypothetical protein